MGSGPAGRTGLDIRDPRRVPALVGADPGGDPTVSIGRRSTGRPEPATPGRSGANPVLAEPAGERIGHGIAALLAGEFRWARTVLTSVADDVEAEITHRLLAQLAGTVIDLLTVGCDDPSARLGQIALDAELAGLPWVARLARGLGEAVLVALGSPAWRVTACVDLLGECERAGDDWGAALLRLAVAIAGQLADPTAERATSSPTPQPVSASWTPRCWRCGRNRCRPACWPETGAGRRRVRPPGGRPGQGGAARPGNGGCARCTHGGNWRPGPRRHQHQHQHQADADADADQGAPPIAADWPGLRGALILLNGSARPADGQAVSVTEPVIATATRHRARQRQRRPSSGLVAWMASALTSTVSRSTSVRSGRGPGPCCGYLRSAPTGTSTVSVWSTRCGRASS